MMFQYSKFKKNKILNKNKSYLKFFKTIKQKVQ